MYSIVKCFFRPYTFFLLAMVLAVAVFWWQRTVSRRRLLWLIAPFLALIVTSTPVAAFLILGTLEWQYPPTTDIPGAEDVIIVLTGSVDPPDKVRLHAELGESSFHRCQHAAELYRRGDPCLVLITGGKVYADTPGPASSEVMRDYLLQLGVEPSHLQIENGSRSTYESAVACRDLLRSQPHDRVFLVTCATHMARSRACFRAQGIEVVPAACNHLATEFRFRFAKFLPSSSALKDVETVAHEWIGLAWYWLHGRI